MTYPLAELIALEGIKIISSNLSQAVYNGGNLEARKNMLYGSILGGMTFSNTRLGNVHAIPDMARDAFKSGNITVNPRRTTENDLIMLYRKAMG